MPIPESAGRRDGGQSGSPPSWSAARYAAQENTRLRALPVSSLAIPRSIRQSIALLDRGDVVRDFHDVVEGCSGGIVQFEDKHIGEGRLRSLDLGGEDGLPPGVTVVR